MLCARPSARPSLPTTRNTLMSRARCRLRRLCCSMTAHSWSQTHVAVSQRSSVVAVPVQGSRSHTVKQLAAFGMDCSLLLHGRVAVCSKQAAVSGLVLLVPPHLPESTVCTPV